MADFKEVSVKTFFLKKDFPFLENACILKEGFSILRKNNISARSYLEIYEAVGGNYGWAGRYILTENKLLEIINSENNLIFVLNYNSKPAGFFELDISDINNVEIVYFGLLPEFYGKGNGKMLMNAAFNEVKKINAKQLWLHTCEFDSDVALPFYKKSGFVIYKTTFETEFYSKDFLSSKLK